MSYGLVDGKVVSPEGCELNVAHHCNLGCASCSHLSPVFRRSLIATETAARDLSLLARSFRARFVKVLGGEPLLHPELVPLLGLVRDSGIAPHTTVCTNGLLLPRMRDNFWAAVDEVEISVYPDRELPEEKMAGVRAYADKHGVRLTLAYYSHFRYSYAERGTEDDGLVRHIYDTCQIAHVWRCHTLYEGHFFKCPQSVFLPQVLEGPGTRWRTGCGSATHRTSPNGCSPTCGRQSRCGPAATAWAAPACAWRTSSATAGTSGSSRTTPRRS
ncbi:radical SAM protein [Streptomyces hygroscopicus]|uniref:radical SAM protein n=1 Tax=Streptomyces hygroscopicus TaxID=1912 RepID=UPI003F1D437E